MKIIAEDFKTIQLENNYKILNVGCEVKLIKLNATKYLSWNFKKSGQDRKEPIEFIFAPIKNQVCFYHLATL